MTRRNFTQQVYFAPGFTLPHSALHRASHSPCEFCTLILYSAPVAGSALLNLVVHSSLSFSRQQKRGVTPFSPRTAPRWLLFFSTNFSFCREVCFREGVTTRISVTWPGLPLFWWGACRVSLSGCRSNRTTCVPLIFELGPVLPRSQTRDIG